MKADVTWAQQPPLPHPPPPQQYHQQHRLTIEVIKDPFFILFIDANHGYLKYPLTDVRKNCVNKNTIKSNPAQNLTNKLIYLFKIIYISFSLFG